MKQELLNVARLMRQGWDMVGHRKTNGILFDWDMDKDEVRGACALGCVALACGMDPEVLSDKKYAKNDDHLDQKYIDIIKCAAGGDGFLRVAYPTEIREYTGEDYDNLYNLIWRLNDGPRLQMDPGEIADYLESVAQESDE